MPEVKPKSEQSRLDELAEEFARRYRCGERPAIAEYARAHPDLAKQIEGLFPTLAMMEQVERDRHDLAERPALRRTAEPPFTRLGDFRIIREIGRGGMGVVYEAEQMSLGRRVAIKVLPREVHSNPKHQKRFVREAKAAARLHHTNIVPVFGGGEQDGLHYYVMQFIQGLGLDDVLVELRRLRGAGTEGQQALTEEESPPGDFTVPIEPPAATIAWSMLSGRFAGRLVEEASSCDEPAQSVPPPADESESNGADAEDTATSRLCDTTGGSGKFAFPGRGEHDSGHVSQRIFWESAAQIGVQAAEALEYAHEQGILHRDVKPGNLLLDTHGTLWVTDFGLAKADDQQDLTHTGDVLGTLRYMSPEQFDGRADARSDVFALGLTLYELLALLPAFDETDRHKLTRQVTTGTPPRLRARVPHLPRDLETIVHKAIDRDPSHRYQTAGELAADLARYLGDEPIRARRISPFTRALRWCRRNPAMAALSITLFLLVTAAAISSTVAAIGWGKLAGHNARLVGQREESLKQKDQALGDAARARASAEASEQRAQETRRAMQRERDTAVHNLYLAQTKEFQRAWEARELGQLRSLLQSWVVSQQQVDQRDWEWFYLHERYLSMMGILRRPGHRMRYLDWHPKTGLLATGGGNVVRIWDRGRVLHELMQERAVMDVAWSPDGSKLAYIEAKGSGICKVWSRENNVERVLESGVEHLRAVDWHPTGRLLAAAHHGGEVLVWDTETGEERQRIKSGAGGMLAVDWSHDGRFLAANSHARLQVWETDGWTMVHSADTRQDGNPLAWAPHAPVLAYGGSREPQRYCVQTWNAETDEVFDVKQLSDQALCIAWSADGSRLAFGGRDHKLHVCQTSDWRELEVNRIHGFPICDIAWSPNSGQLAATASVDHVVVIAVGHAGRDPYRTFEMSGYGREVVWHPERPVVCISQRDGAISVWDLEMGEQLWNRQANGVGRLAWSPDGRQLVGSLDNGKVVVWDGADGSERQTIPENGGHEAGGFIWGAGNTELTLIDFIGKRARTWNFERRAYVREIELADRDIWKALPIPGTTDLAIAYEGTRGGIVSSDGRLRYELIGHRDTIVDIAVDLDGRRIATASKDGTAIVWDVETGRSLVTLLGHEGTVKGIAWAPGGTRLATCSHDGTVRMWDADTGVEVLRLDVPGSVLLSVDWSNDGRMIAATDREKHLYVWSAQMDLGDQSPRTAHALTDREGIVRPEAGLEVEGKGTVPPPNTPSSREE